MIVAVASGLAGGVVAAGDVGGTGFGAGGVTALDEAVFDCTFDEIGFVGGFGLGGLLVVGLAVGGLAVLGSVVV